MEEVAGSESIADLKDIEAKIGRKTPEGLLRWMREEPASRGDRKLSCPESSDSEKKGLDAQIRKLKVDMAHLRAVDVRILQQLLTLHEGIEAVKWLLEERMPLASRCSSLTSSQYSLGEGADTSWRGSWSSLQDQHDRLDNISVGSYLDTLADDLDEHCSSSGAESVLCSTPLGTDTSVRTGDGIGAEAGGAASGARASQVRADPLKEDGPDRTKTAPEAGKPSPEVNHDSGSNKSNGSPERAVQNPVAEKDSPRTCVPEKPEESASPKGKPCKNGKVSLESCKMNGKRHLEYDAHWRWVQSQDDVTFL
ncbi:leucine rich adaptor protein 1 isoform X1 [Electrophorus electricus]|uniref:Leucine rich adaptor protein 1 n=1 Tax=Electrophorus electricus TaxID=8005 RepID=A0A4W4G5W4_ELEEL|nr:leucine rich adaptor protein 1 isoform X1 [Electrophorus electricus]